MLVQIKEEIYRRANNGESGATLAAEFKVSRSLISNIKNHYKPLVTSGTEVIASDTEVVDEEKQLFLVVSPRLSKAEEVRSNAKTFGEFLKEISQSDNMSGLFKTATSTTRTKLLEMKDAIPENSDLDKNKAISVILIPTKTEAGSR